MADTKISALTAATLYNTGDVSPIVQAGTTKKLDLSTVFTKFSRTTFSNANYTILATDRYVATTTTVFTASRTLTLPAANALGAGTLLYISDDGAAITTAFTLSIARAGTDTIHGGTASIVLLSPRAAVILETDGVSNWTTVSRSPAARIQTLTTGTTFTTTVGCKAMYVECVGGGGAGGGAVAAASACSIGCGGGGGGYSATFIVNPKTSYPYVVGAGGTAVSGAAGNNGTDTTWDTVSVCTAKAGGGGTLLASGTSQGTGGAPGSPGLASSGVGDFKEDGEWGTECYRFSGTLGAFVGSGGAAGGIGGGSMLGGIGSVNTAGTAGHSYGGGGAGGLSFNATGVAGGAGAPGCIIVTEFF